MDPTVVAAIIAAAFSVLTLVLRAPFCRSSRDLLRRMRAGVIAVTLMGSDWYYVPMEAVVDQAGRIVLPKYIRDALGLLPGTKVDISPYGAGVQVVPVGRTARLVEEDGVLVSSGDTPVDDDILFGLIDAGRK